MSYYLLLENSQVLVFVTNDNKKIVQKVLCSWEITPAPSI